ncbi:MAG: hypothetical protein HY074_17530 [Deltaproteobacteria bacterium]|nr:hypothetical protein [Deltaproteobacteria bacterium]
MNWSFVRTIVVNLAYVTLILLSVARYNHASDFFITSVIRELPMKSGEVLYKDYYINAGSNNGLKKGLIIEAVRKISAFDNINSKLVGDTSVKIAKLKLIHVDKGVSVARLVKYYDKETTPITGYDSVMIGDLIEVAEKQ